MLAGASIGTMAPSGITTAPVSSVDVTFDQVVQPATFTQDDIAIQAPDGQVINLSADPVDSGDQQTFTLNFTAAVSLPGTYRVQIGPDVLNASGEPMNQDGDGTDGELGQDEFNDSFTINAVPQTLPVVQDFDGGDIANLPGWSFKTDFGKTIELTNNDNAQSGLYHLKFDQSSSGESRGTATLVLDLTADAGATDLTLDFWTKELTTSSSNFMQIYVSGDGVSYSFVASPGTAIGEYVHYSYDLDDMLSTRGITLDGDVYIDFRHRGLSTSHETTLDDVRVSRGLDVSGPRVVSHVPNTPQVGPISNFDVTFDEPIDGATFLASDVTVRDPSGNPVTLSGAPVDTGDKLTWRVNFASPQTLAGEYDISIGPDVRDLAGNQMNQIGDASNGSGTDAYNNEIHISAPALTVPFTEGFEGGSVAALTNWAFATSGTGRIQVIDTNSPHGGQYQLEFGHSVSGSGNSEATLKFDLSSLSGATDLTLDFWVQESTDFSNSLSLYVSGDGTSWQGVSSVSNVPVNENFHVAFDLDAALTSKGISFDGDVYLQLRHFSGGSAGYRYRIDDLRVAQGLDVFGPTVVGQSPNTPQQGPLNFVDVTFNEPVNGATFTSAEILVSDPLGNPVALSGNPVDSGDQTTWRLNFDQPQTQAGSYTLRIGTGVQDPAGNPLNRDQDEVNGNTNDSFVTTFDLLTTPISVLPYLEGFEAGSTAALTAGWSFATTGPGTVEVVDTNSPQSGTYHLEFGQNGSGSSTADAIVKLDLTSYAGANDLTLDFWTQESTAFSSNYLTLFVSGDGTSWNSITSIDSTPVNQNFHAGFDLDAMLTANGITFDSDVYVRLRHIGGSSGYATRIDDFRIAQGIDVFGPRVISQNPSVPQQSPIDFVDVTFNEPIDSSSFTSSQVSVIDPLGHPVVLVGNPVDSGDKMTWRLNFASQQSLPGEYRVGISVDVQDLAGNTMNQEGDELNGEANDGYVNSVVIAAVPQTLPVIEDFESGDISNLSGWSFATSGSKTIEISMNSTPHAGTHHLLFSQTTGNSSIGEANLALDLSGEVGATDLTLDFWMKEFSESSSSYAQL
ncbi:MAG: Ig-like domain-containing protein, partial [Planctomycetaceae bacterium]|nr:Ig-like domain-containing protein [Planctomycetaceae bacterium]